MGRVLTYDDVGIKNAFHALALDEIRYPFLPTIMHLPKNEKGEPLQGVLALRFCSTCLTESTR